MPVTIRVAPHDARPVRQSLHRPPSTSEETLKFFTNRGKNQNSATPPILRTGLGQQTSLPDAKLGEKKLTIEDHGLVRAAYYAYSEHYHLVLRPEDIWVAILTQFSFFVNANSEKLRSSFVAHEGKNGLILRDPGQPDMGLMCRNMTKLIDQNIVDPKLREWILPSFTTTTMHDEVVAAVIMMGTLQKYFDYVFDCSCCGIPTVTLMGELSDWEDIQQRIEKLREYGEEPTLFCDMLRPIMRFFVASFTKGPGDPEVIKFWTKIIHRESGSGMDTLCGWMVAFCFWDEDGKRNSQGYEYAGLDELLGEKYHTVEFDQVPAGFVSVPVTYIDPEEVVIETKLLAGFVGFESTTAVEFPYSQPAGKAPTVSGDVEMQPTSSLRAVAVRLWSQIRCGVGKPKPIQEPSAGEKAKPSGSPVAKDGSSITIVSEKKAAAANTAKKAAQKPTISTDQLDTIQPLTGWWMYEVQGSSKSRAEFYADKMKNEWNGQASTGYVQEDGQTVVVKEGLPRDWNSSLP